MIRIHEGAWYSPQEGESRDIMHLWRPERAKRGYRYFWWPGPSAHTVLVEVERYQQKAPQVTAFGGPQIVKEEGTSAA